LAILGALTFKGNKKAEDEEDISEMVFGASKKAIKALMNSENEHAI